LAPSGRHLRFGSDLVIEGTYPRFRVQRRHPDVEVELDIHATNTVSHFFKMRGGLYDHWSLLCKYEGLINETAVSGLCTY